ncbi:TonB-dependent receptor [Methylotenera versatilis]|uniref:TonB-dependent receptor n=1 Tax=Methylotenera versatilis TaxID=1055487 RepID=UPI000645A019|nr:TonB-dependent receptor [Methylotenera versatilis]
MAFANHVAGLHFAFITIHKGKIFMRSYFKNGSSALEKEQNSATNGLRPQFKRKLLASAVSFAIGASILAPNLAFAETSIADLQAENARLKQELEEIKKGLQSKAEQPAAETEEVAEEAPPESKKAEFAASDTLDAVIVTSRNRAELAQEIPLPVRVLGGERLDRDDIKSIWDLQSVAPNLQLNNPGENARKVSPGIRGLGRGGANDSMEQSVGIIVDGVTLYYSGQAWSDYVDLDRIEVMYGPQGTLQGKNSSLGAINIVTKAPSFTPSSKFEITTGELNTLQGKFSATGPLVDDKLAYRGTFLVDRQDGLYENTYQSLGRSKETWREANKIAGRVQLLWTPTENLTGRFIADKLRSDERVNTGNVLDSNGPATYANGVARPITNPLGGYTPTGSYVNYGYLGKFAQRSAWFHNADGSVYQPEVGTTDIANSEARPQVSNQWGVSGRFDWQVADHTLTSISAYRYQDFDIKNGGQFGQFYVSNSGQQLWNDQFSQELRIASDTGKGKLIDYQAGLYYLNAEVLSDDPTYFGPDAGAWNATNGQFTTLIADAPGRELLRKSLDGMYQSSVTDARVTSKAVYGSADWHVTDKATLNGGIRFTKETKTNKLSQELDRAGEDLAAIGAASGASAAQIAAAEAIRANQINDPFGWVQGNTINKNLVAWNLSPSFKISDDAMVYGSVGKGVKSGFIYFTQDLQPGDVGLETTIKPEKVLDYELGFKSLLLGKKLQLNANLFRTEVTDYQASWRRDDPSDPTKTITGWGNAPKVLARGIELEANYRATNRLDINLAAGYSKSTYEDQWLVQVPEINNTTTYFDAKGQQIANIPKFTINYGANYQFPVSNYLGRITLQNTYRSSSYFNDNHADFTYQKGYNVTTLGLGLGALNKKWELSVIARNVFDTEYAISKSTYSNTAGQTSNIGMPRNLTATFKYNL